MPIDTKTTLTRTDKAQAVFDALTIGTRFCTLCEKWQEFDYTQYSMNFNGEWKAEVYCLVCGRNDFISG